MICFMLPWLAYVFSVGVGLVLGLLGGGGSILMLPILLYILKVEDQQAITMTLLIVGITSAYSFLPYHKSKQVRWPEAILFGSFGIIGSMLGSKQSLSIPPFWLKTTFAAMMIIVALRMLQKSKTILEASQVAIAPMKLKSILVMGVSGIAVGYLSGLVGAGGGFLIVPALLITKRFSMKEAIGSSLLIIFLQSLGGLFKRLQALSIPWNHTWIILGCCLIGASIGTHLSKTTSPEKLKIGFAILVLCVGLGMLVFTLIS